MLVTPGSVPNSIGGIAFGNDGNLYLSRIGASTGDVRRFDGHTGAFLGVFINDSAHLAAPTEIFFRPEPASLSALGCALILLARRGDRWVA
jgi:hypothetical protein